MEPGLLVGEHLPSFLQGLLLEHQLSSLLGVVELEQQVQLALRPSSPLVFWPPPSSFLPLACLRQVQLVREPQPSSPLPLAYRLTIAQKFELAAFFLGLVRLASVREHLSQQVRSIHACL